MFGLLLGLDLKGARYVEGGAVSEDELQRYREAHSFLLPPLFLFISTFPPFHCCAAPFHLLDLPPPSNDAHALSVYTNFEYLRFAPLPLPVTTQAIADVAHSQLAMYSMQHEQRPNVQVAATLLEGLCYSNKWVYIWFFLLLCLSLSLFTP